MMIGAPSFNDEGTAVSGFDYLGLNKMRVVFTPFFLYALHVLTFDCSYLLRIF